MQADGEMIVRRRPDAAPEGGVFFLRHGSMRRRAPCSARRAHPRDRSRRLRLDLSKDRPRPSPAVCAVKVQAGQAQHQGGQFLVRWGAHRGGRPTWVMPAISPAISARSRGGGAIRSSIRAASSFSSALNRSSGGEPGSSRFIVSSIHSASRPGRDRRAPTRRPAGRSPHDWTDRPPGRSPPRSRERGTPNRARDLPANELFS